MAAVCLDLNGLPYCQYKVAGIILHNAVFQPLLFQQNLV